MPAPSPPGLKSSIEYLAMSVGIGRTLYGPPSLLVLLDQRYENIELVTIGVLLGHRRIMLAAIGELAGPAPA